MKTGDITSFEKSKGVKMKGSCTSFKTWLYENLLLILTFSGVVTGVLAGLALRYYELDPLTINIIAYPGELFMRLLKLMILPLVIASLITGSASLNAKMSGMVAFRTILYFLVTSLLAACVGLVLVISIHPGDNSLKTELGEGNTEAKKTTIVDTFLDLGRNLLPDNLFQAAFQSAGTVFDPEKEAKALIYRNGTNTLGIIFFCLAFGTVLGSLGAKAAGVIEFFSVVDECIMRMVSIIMWLSPVGISSVITAKILSVPNLAVVMSQLGLFIVTVCGGIFLYQFTLLQAIYFVFVRKNPFKFWCQMFQAWMTSFATASTATALPISLQCLEKAGVDKRIRKFVLPIGATVNMDGTALFVTVASIFIAQMNNIELNAADYVTVVLTSTAASVASASVPSAALVLMLIVLTAIDAPVKDVSLLWAVDWFVDRCRTTNNMLGDAYGAAVVEALSRKELEAMDAVIDNADDNKESVKPGPDEEALIGIYKSASNQSNGSSVKVREEILTDTSNSDED